MAKDLEKGGISVQTEHIFPIIKRWLYSDKEIFLRELVSNASDAITKMKRLSSLGELPEGVEVGEPRIDVVLDEALSTITVSDNGIGMTQDEIKKYINQIALSGALEFIQKYEGKSSDDAGNGIIGHFGLGFYSAFMVADTVEIKSKSFVPGETASYWRCEESGEFEMGEGDRSERGTDVILHVTDDEKEFLSAYKLKEILDKYCSFMPVPIYFKEIGKEEEKKEDGKEEEGEKEEKPVNDTSPLWQKNPSECTDEEYKAFYRKVFKDFRDPLFYIHINADFPLNFKGILYFPRIQNEYEKLEGQVKLYYNQVFVADNIKEVVPEYLLLLKGVIDCPELPLNVSRSYLQNNAYVAKVSNHITKKVSDKLSSLFNNEREKYEGFWDDIKPFIEYGCLKDEKFYERTKSCVIYKTVDGKYLTLDEYFEKSGYDKDAKEKKVYYVQSKLQQVNYIKLFKEQNIEILLLDALIDSQFISFIESKNEGVKFVRADSEIDSALKSEKDEEKAKSLEDALGGVFSDVVGKQTKVVFEPLKSTKTPALVTLSESDRRFSDMMKLYSGNLANDPVNAGETLVVNAANPLIEKLSAMAREGENAEKVKKLAKQIYMLAVLAQRQLTSDELESFVSDSFGMLEDL